MEDDIKLILEKIIAEQANLTKLITGVGTRVKETKDALSGTLYENSETLHNLGEFHKTLQKKYDVWPLSSMTTTEIDKALSKALNQIHTPIATGTGNRKPCVSIDDMKTVAAPILEQHGLSFVQKEMINEYDEDVLVSRITHTSGEWHQSISKIRRTKAGLWDWQEFSSGVSNLKRIHMNTMLGFDNASAGKIEG